MIREAGNLIQKGRQIVAQRFPFPDQISLEHIVVDVAGNTTISGIDVSNWQGAIDWVAVAGSSIDFAFMKASEGITYTDSRLAANWAGAKTVGLIRGAYHYARPELNTPQDEAAYFLGRLAAVGGLEAGDLVVLDLEGGSGNLLQWTLDWLTTVEASVGCKPLLYSSPSFLNSHGLLGDATLSQYGLWLASWGSSQPTPPPNWPVWACWQYSASGTVSGISGYVDLDTFNGTRSQMVKYGAPPPPTKPQPTNDDLVQLCKYVLSGDMKDTITYAQKFV